MPKNDKVRWKHSVKPPMSSCGGLTCREMTQDEAESLLDGDRMAIVAIQVAAHSGGPQVRHHQAG